MTAQRTNKTCSAHDGVFCSECKRFIHAACAGLRIERPNGEDGEAFLVDPKSGERTALHVLTQDDTPWYCVRCAEKSSSPSVPYNKLDSGERGFAEKCRRVGLEPSSFPQSTLKARLRSLNDYITGLKEAVRDDAMVSRILDASPRPFPTHKPMDEDTADKMGRRLEVTLLHFDVSTCACCSRTKPFHSDKYFRPYRSFKPRHLNDPYHVAYECTCADVCGGSQFYSHGKRNDQKFYSAKHNNRSYRDGLADETLTECLLCDFCHKYNGSLQLGRPFSARNGYGPVPACLPSSSQHRLHTLLDSLTTAEEAAIRQVVPLQCILHLRHGNIANKGTTSCCFVFVSRTREQGNIIIKSTSLRNSIRTSAHQQPQEHKRAFAASKSGKSGNHKQQKHSCCLNSFLLFGLC